MRFVQREKTLINYLKIDENRKPWGCDSECFKKNKKICSKCSNQLDLFKISVTGSELSYEPKEELQDNWEVRKSLPGRISVISEIMIEDEVPLYLTSPKSGADCYIFVTDDKKSQKIRLTIAFRGTESRLDVLNDLAIHRIPFRKSLNLARKKLFKNNDELFQEDSFKKLQKDFEHEEEKIQQEIKDNLVEKVHQGFFNQYKTMMLEKENEDRFVDVLDIKLKVKKLRKRLKKENRNFNETFEILVTGHSLGGALAVLCARHVQMHPKDFGLPKNFDIKSQLQCVTFGAPMVGNKKMKNNFTEFIPKIYQFRNENDPIPYLLSPSHGYTHMMKNNEKHDPEESFLISFENPPEPNPASNFLKFLPFTTPCISCTDQRNAHSIDNYEKNLLDQISPYLIEENVNKNPSTSFDSGLWSSCSTVYSE